AIRHTIQQEKTKRREGRSRVLSVINFADCQILLGRAKTYQEKLRAALGFLCCLRSGVFSTHDGRDLTVDRRDVALTIHFSQEMLGLVVRDQCGGIVMVDAQALTNGSLLVIDTLCEGGAAHITNAFFARRLLDDVIGSAAARVGTAPAS